MSITPKPARRHDLDWLRSLAILALVVFHSAMPFVAEWDWHIRNTETSSLLLEFNYFISRFRMAVLFVVAGISMHLMGSRRSIGSFLRDRAVRLMIPLVFGILVVVPPQIYVERLADGDFTGSYLAFWPRTLRLVPYPAGDTSYHHLWFIFYLFLYAVLLTPLIAWARTPTGTRQLAAWRAWLSAHGVMALSLPIVAVFSALVRHFSGSQNIVDDVAMFLVYLLYTVVGWIIGDDSAIWERIVADRHRMFRLALSCLLVVTGVRWSAAVPEDGIVGAGWLALLALHAWSWVMTILGFACRWLDRDHAILRWSREASYPIYILHQTIIVVVAYHVVQADEPVLTKFLFTVVVSLLLTVAVYEAAVRPFAAIRWLFGMTTPRSR